ncbi:thiamine pyrophosphate-binding protein [Propionimicrobium sp. PCR01-08-3]|uniref:thiamine pyrophosphate-binding protein n=1 Tax=Propionimicrobium sp. PCR01-08-3 TaxID=3052086 RepID=UPI00255C3D00|nr:thiamine pyrophosphate-binding protein [Propionimicrobium sp. PCR01-08-3]WIY83114.1 thiamine pyrophosphate-binding protein [Propionimicrobium sp. PCR01-08-3]
MSSARLGLAIAGGLASAGIRNVVVCPGSRSTAAAVAFAQLAARGELRLHTRTDERGAGFLALGLAKAGGAAAIVVTSGTAVGNLMPAVMEARAAGVSLAVITADRPATLIGTGANQTTDQLGIFGRQVVAGLNLASSDDAPKAWASQLTRVLACCLGVRTREPGPVHINAAFTEPFLDAESLDESDPVGDIDPTSARSPSVNRSRSDDRPALVGDDPAGTGERSGQVASGSSVVLEDDVPGMAVGPGTAATGDVVPSQCAVGGGTEFFAGSAFSVSASRPALPTRLEAGPRTVVLAGDAPLAVGRRARELAEHARVPLLAEPSSNARSGGCAIARYRLLLDGEVGKRIERVLVFGHPTLSRPVSRLISRDDVELVIVSDRANWPDPGWSANQVVDDVELEPADNGEWLDEWKTADRQVQKNLLTGTSPAGERTGSGQLGEAGAPVAATADEHRADPESRPAHPHTAQPSRGWSESCSKPTVPVSERPVTGQQVANAVVASTPENLVFGASNLIRNADLAPIPAATTDSTETACWANRGLAGIDGVIATATGIALATAQPATVLLGDLGFLHDAGSLHIPAGQPVPDLRVVVADDNGGSIFSTLEVADSPYYDELFAMPHGRDLAKVAAGYGWPTTRIDSIDELTVQLSAPPHGIEIVVAAITDRS